MALRLKLAIALVLIAAGVAIAEISYDSNKPLVGTDLVDANPSTISSADAQNYDTPLRPRRTQGDSKVVISPTFSVHGATACLEVVVYQRTSTTDIFATVAAVETVTATSLKTIGGRYPTQAQWILAPTLGAQIFDVRVRSISSGNVTWRAWHLGADSAPAPAANQ